MSDELRKVEGVRSINNNVKARTTDNKSSQVNTYHGSRDSANPSFDSSSTASSAKKDSAARGSNRY